MTLLAPSLSCQTSLSSALLVCFHPDQLINNVSTFPSLTPVHVDSVYPGVRAETSTRVAGGPQGFESEGLRGLKALGVRELSYRLAFLACNVAPTNPRVRITHCSKTSSTVADVVVAYNSLVLIVLCCSLVGRNCERRSKLLKASRAR